jgi:hypothetical protein
MMHESARQSGTTADNAEDELHDSIYEIASEPL